MPDTHRKNQCSCNTAFWRGLRQCIFTFQSDGRRVFTSCYQTTSTLAHLLFCQPCCLIYVFVAMFPSQTDSLKHKKTSKEGNEQVSKCCMVSLSNLTPILWGLCPLANSEKSWNGPVDSGFYSWEINESCCRIILRIYFIWATLLFINNNTTTTYHFKVLQLFL